MPKIVIDSALERKSTENFDFPLGAYPVDEVKPTPGYVVEFESADGDIEADWEEWPDRFVFDVQVTNRRLRPLCRMLFSLLPSRVYPILDVLGNDAYREIDPYIAFELVGIERFLDGVLHFEEWLFEDGMVGFGAMSMDPFLYLFIDEHKAVTIRAGAELKDRVERILSAFDLGPVKEIIALDSVAHEHRSVLLVSETGADGSLAPEDVVDWLVDNWMLQLNIDPRTNVDEQGMDLGHTPWRVVARCVAEEGGPAVQIEVYLVAGCIENAQMLAIDATKTIEDPRVTVPVGGWYEVQVPVCDRLTPDSVKALTGAAEPPSLEKEQVLIVRCHPPDNPLSGM